MNENQLHLLRTRRFLPLFLTRSLGAFNDNLYKNAIIFLATFGTGISQDIDPNLLVPVAGGLFILQFFLFSATAGQLAEIHDKARLIRLVKLSEVVLMVLAAIALVQQSVPMLMFLLFMMGTQSTFFGPLKFSILPDHLKEHELILALAIANGLVALYITRLLPGALAKALLAWLLELFYRIEVKGVEHFHAVGDKVLIVANHQSFLDPALVAAHIPADLTFAVNTFVNQDKVFKKADSSGARPSTVASTGGSTSTRPTTSLRRSSSIAWRASPSRGS